MTYDFDLGETSDELEKETEIYNAVENGLTSKYGATEYSSDTGKAIAAFEEDIPFDSYATSENCEFMRMRYSHRLIENSDGTYVFIEHYLKHTIMKDMGKTFTSYSSRVNYMLLDQAAADKIMQNIASVQNDL